VAEKTQTDKPTERTRFIRPLTLLIITGVLVLALVLLFPARRYLTLSHSTEGQVSPSNVSITYLEALLKANPADERLRLNLARELAAAGNIPYALEVMEPLASSRDTNTLWLYNQITWQAFNALEAGDPRRAERRGELIAQMSAIEQREDLSTEQLETLARRWLSLEKPVPAAKLYERLGEQGAENAYAWYAEAGRWWLAADNAQRSARAWQSAFEVANDESRRRDAALAALDAAQQTNDGSSLTMAARFIEAYPQDPTFLDIGIEMALANNRLAQAQQWSHRYVALRPDDEQGLRRDTQIALARDQLDVALQGLHNLVDRNPDDDELRAQLAQVQVWAGQPQAALASYQRVARRANSDEYDNQIIDLATDLNDTAAVLAALNRIQSRHPLDIAQRKLLVDILNSEGPGSRHCVVVELGQSRLGGSRAVGAPCDTTGLERRYARRDSYVAHYF